MGILKLITLYRQKMLHYELQHTSGNFFSSRWWKFLYVFILLYTLASHFLEKKISRKVRQGWAIFKSPYTYSLYLQVISQMHFQIIIFFILVSAAGISCVERKMQANICQTQCTNIKKISHEYKNSNQRGGVLKW